MGQSVDEMLAQDKALRDAALGLVKADWCNVKAEVQAKSIASRLGTRISEGAADLYEEAAETAHNHSGIVKLLIGAAGAWFVFGPLRRLLTRDEDKEEGDS